MKSLQVFLMLTCLLSEQLFITSFATRSFAGKINVQSPSSGSEPRNVPDFLRRTDSGRRLLRMTCDKNPRVCGGGNNPTRACCNKKCVDLLADSFNCGKCGIKCKFQEKCFRGKCVNPLWDTQHCGRLNNSCRSGGSCVYGMCNYASSVYA